jgi:hypothetical protein
MVKKHIDTISRLKAGSLVLVRKLTGEMLNTTVLEDLGGKLRVQVGEGTSVIESTFAVYVTYDSAVDDLSQGGNGRYRQYRWDGETWRRGQMFLGGSWGWGVTISVACPRCGSGPRDLENLGFTSNPLDPTFRCKGCGHQALSGTFEQHAQEAPSTKRENGGVS